MVKMKKIFPYLFALFLIMLGFLIYGHWFSPNKPLAYYPPVNNHFPEKLKEIKVEDINGDTSLLKMKEAPLTVFVVTPYLPSIPVMNYYSYFSGKRNLMGESRIVFLWNLGNDEDATRAHIQKVAKDDPLGRFILTNRMLSLYQQNKDLEIATFPVIFAYNQQGELVYKGGNNPNQKSKVLAQLMSVLR